MTVRELQKRLAEIHPNDLDEQLRVVFHGYEKPSFNLPVDAVMEGPNHDFQFIVNEPRGENP
jgi:hypothetical protein